MTIREFFNAWIGAADDRNVRIEGIRDICFSAHRFSAASTAMSKEASRKIANHKFPWEKRAQKSETLNYDNMIGFFDIISRSEDG